VFDRDELSRRSLRYYIGATTAVFLVAELETAIVGDAIVAFRRDSSVARLYSLAVAPSATGRGLGRALLRRCEREADARGSGKLRLEVRADNAAAIALYRSAGYHEFGRYDDYYEDGASALRFEKDLTHPR
jgi:[ribosomal protein S18]-alanine N-acetyltransferase